MIFIGPGKLLRSKPLSGIALPALVEHAFACKTRFVHRSYTTMGVQPRSFSTSSLLALTAENRGERPNKVRNNLTILPPI
jgi:hypothetical protein